MKEREREVYDTILTFIGCVIEPVEGFVRVEWSWADAVFGVRWNMSVKDGQGRADMQGNVLRGNPNPMT